MWTNFYCTNKNCRAFLGLQNSSRIIVGGTLIKQPRTNILCPKCPKVRKDSWDTDSRLLKILSEDEIAAILAIEGYEPDAETDFLKSLENKRHLI